MRKKLIIIGGVAAGPKAAAKARREDKDLNITIYTSERDISYGACGLTFYIADYIKDKQKLYSRSIEDFKQKEDINVHNLHEVTSIDTQNKTVTVKNLTTGEEFIDKYDKLIIATGAHPFVPRIEGTNLQNVFTLRNVEVADTIKTLIDNASVKKALIVGGGYIGVEAAEAFAKRGLEVVLVELADQILPFMDKDMTDMVEQHCKENGVILYTTEEVKQLIGDSNGKVQKVITNRREIEADLVLMSIGVRPNVELARKAGIEIGLTGAIKVNDKMETSTPDIYAAGDCAEQWKIVSEKPTWIPLGSTSNKQGRVAAINATGGNAIFPGILGTAITKVFDLDVAITGLSAKKATRLGIEYEEITIQDRCKAKYLDGNDVIKIKLLAEKNSGRLIGCEIVGYEGVDKRIDIAAMALMSRMTALEFSQVDLAYSPPYSTTIDVILTAAFVLTEKLEKLRTARV